MFPEIAWRGPFKTYRDAMVGTTEASDVAHFAALWAATALRLGRRVSFHYGLTLFANVDIALFGPTGDRKTTASRRTLTLVEGIPTIKTLLGVGSAEGLADWLGSTDQEGEEPAARTTEEQEVSHFLFLEELSELLTRGRWDGSPLLGFLTHVYDCPDHYELRYRRKPIHLEKPTLSFFACTTPALYWQHLREVDLYSGFANRMLYLTGPMKPPMPLPVKPDTDKLAAVRKYLSRLDTLQPCEALLSLEAQPLWSKFYIAWRNTDLDELVKAATERVPAYILKLAMTYAALEETLPSITEEQLKAAIAVGRYATRCAQALIAQRTTTSAQGACEEAIRRVLKAGALVKNGDNREYGVTLAQGMTSCSCKDALYRGVICKHATAVALHVLRTPQPKEQPAKLLNPLHLMWHDGSVLCGTQQPSRFWVYPWTENVWNWSDICSACKAAWKQPAVLAAAA